MVKMCLVIVIGRGYRDPTLQALLDRMGPYVLKVLQIFHLHVLLTVWFITTLRIQSTSCMESATAQVRLNSFLGNSFKIIARYSDVWRYNLTSNLWTWIGGSTGLNNVATYGTKGVAASTNLPGSRDSTALVCDANGFLYTFGGYGYDTTGGGKYFFFSSQTNLTHMDSLRLPE